MDMVQFHAPVAVKECGAQTWWKFDGRCSHGALPLGSWGLHNALSSLLNSLCKQI